MLWDIEFTDEFEVWWNGLDEAEQEAVDASMRLLEFRARNVPFPHGSEVETSRHRHMRELRLQHQGRTYRILYAFDRRRTALLLICADKAGDERWYETNVPFADRLYDEHLEQLRKEGWTDG